MEKEELKDTIIIKNEEDIDRGYINCLATWLRCENTARSFFKKFKAHHWRDFDFFPTIKTTRKRLIMPKEILLIDRVIDGESWFVICKIQGSTTRKKPIVKHLFKVVKTSELSYWKAGYWLLPKFNIHD